MTYQVLARKWRPGNFGDMVGQSHVLKPLTHALDNQRLHHAYLFTGTRGVGKTSLARIVAKCLNCEKGVSSSPCGECGPCTEIAEGRFIDLIEVDAASKTKVEDTRELLENVLYAPSSGRFKIYLIDEVHMLSTHSFNALLKTLEEPPPHVKFLLATTDPQKLPITVLSRCLQFNLKNINPQMIAAYLQEILNKEGIEFEESALWQLANSARGSMRDALTLLDQAISFCEGQVTADGVTQMLGTPDQSLIFQILESLYNKDTPGLLTVIAQVAELAPDYEQLLESTLATLHRIAIALAMPDYNDNSFGDNDEIRQFADKFSAEDLQLYYQFGTKGKADLQLATDQRAMFEMLMIRMLVFSPEGTPTMPGTSKQTPAAPEQSSAPAPAQKKKSPEPVVQAKQASEPEEAAVLTKPAATAPAVVADIDAEAVAEKPTQIPQKDNNPPTTQTEPAPVAVTEIDAEVAAVESTQIPPADNTATPTQTAPEPPASSPGDKIAAVDAESCELDSLVDPKQWITVFPQLETSGITGNILANCIVDKVADNHLKLTLNTSQSALFNEDHRMRIETILSEFFNRQLQVEIAIDALAVESPAANRERLRLQEIEDMQDRFTQDETVQTLLNNFSGEIIADSISPIEP